MTLAPRTVLALAGLVVIAVGIRQALRHKQPGQGPDAGERPRSSTTAEALSALTRDQLYREAQRLDIKGRSHMRKAELTQAIAARQAVPA